LKPEAIPASELNAPKSPEQTKEEKKKESFKRKMQLLFFAGIVMVVFIFFPFTLCTY
jgi:uncharacterized membrane protein YvbJ